MQIQKDFLLELFKICLKNNNILSVCAEHLEYHYLPSQSYKSLWQEIKNYYIVYKENPSFGYISQKFGGSSKEDSEVLDLLAKVNQISMPNSEAILKELEDFILKVMSISFGTEYTKLFNKGKHEEAKKLLIDTADIIQNFTLFKNTNHYDYVFGGFKSRMESRQLNKQFGLNTNIYSSHGIDELDDRTFGGLKKTDMVLFIASSGIGKTLYLRHRGITNARLGHKTLHIQIEGSTEESLDGFDSNWTAKTLFDLEYANIPLQEVEDLINRAEYVKESLSGEIIHIGVEKFDSGYSVSDLNKEVEIFEKIHGEPPFEILIDYFELLEPGDGKRYDTGVAGEKARRSAIAKRLKNLCIVHKTRICTPTQASDVPFALKNDPNFKITRNDITANKNLIDAFTYVFSFNQTDEEYKEGRMRIYCDKARKAKRDWTADIFQDLSHGRFYDRYKTMTVIHNQNLG
jgi:hypothetical protein